MTQEEKMRDIAQRKMILCTDEKSEKHDKLNHADGKPKRGCFIYHEEWVDTTHIKEWGIFGCPKLL